MDTITALRVATRPLHTRVEEQPLAQALANGTVQRDEYVGLVGVLLGVYETFEKHIAPHAELRAVWHDLPNRTAALRRDLEAFGATPLARKSPVVSRWAEQLEAIAEQSPSVWAGAGYVLEGSRMGSRMLLPKVAEALNLPPQPGHGVDFHLEACNTPRDAFPRLIGTLTAIDQTPLTRDAMVRGAVATFELMIALHATAESADADMSAVSAR